MKKGNTPKYEILALLVLAFIVIAARNVPDYVSEHIWGYGECWQVTAMKNGFQKIVYIARNTRKRQIKKEKKENSRNRQNLRVIHQVPILQVRQDRLRRKNHIITIRARAVRIRTNRVTRVRPRAKNRIRILMNPTTKDMRMCMRMAIMTMTGIIVIRIMQMEWTMR